LPTNADDYGMGKRQPGLLCEYWLLQCLAASGLSRIKQKKLEKKASHCRTPHTCRMTEKPQWTQLSTEQM